MAIDQNAILQLLTQLQGGGGPPITPSSGLKEPSLSGLALGEQGMGFGGGGSLLGGGGGVGGGTEGPGLDLLSLFNQSPAPAASGQALGQLNIPFPGFGAGGFLHPSSIPQSQQSLGQAGVGGGGLLGTLSALLKSGKSLSDILKNLSTPTGVSGGAQNLPAGLADLFAGEAGTGVSSLLPEFPLEATGLTGPGGGTFSAAGNLLPTLGAGIGATSVGPQAVSAPFLAGGGPESVGALQGLAGAGSLGASLPTLGADATSTLGGFASALSPVSGVLSLLSLADLFGAPKLGFGNIFFGQKANDFTAAQTEAALQQAGALAKAGGPLEQLIMQKALDNILFKSIGQFDEVVGPAPFGAIPTLTPFGAPLPAATGQTLLSILQNPKGTLQASDVATFLKGMGPNDTLTLLKAIDEQRRLRTYAGLPTLAAPPPSVENALFSSLNPQLKAAQAEQLQKFPPAYDPLAGGIA